MQVYFLKIAFLSNFHSSNLLDDNKLKNLNLLVRMKMAKDAALGILWLHSSNPQIIHRDLKGINSEIINFFHVDLFRH